MVGVLLGDGDESLDDWAEWSPCQCKHELNLPQVYAFQNVPLRIFPQLSSVFGFQKFQRLNFQEYYLTSYFDVNTWLPVTKIAVNLNVV